MMKRGICWAVLWLGVSVLVQVAKPAEAVLRRVILDPVSVANLSIETARVARTNFEDTLFVLGRVEVIPDRRAMVSSRIPGRIAALRVLEGDTVEKGAVVAVVESRQPGNPPPRTELVAPLGGLVAHGHASLGEPVEPTKEILEILDLSEVYAVAQIPEDRVGELQPRMRARIRIAALPNAVFKGELLRFGTAADRDSGTLEAVFLLSNFEGLIRPDMRAEFSIILRKREHVLAVPRSALLSDPQGDYVFVKDFDLENTFVRANVEIGMRNDADVEIIKGLFPGDDVVIKGAYPLAYAGEGTISLKDALDAAHGHEHNEDGSEMTAAQQAAGQAYAHGGKGQGLTLFLGVFCVVLLVLLVLSQLSGKRELAKEGASDA